jgi:hypothetical protein
VEDRAEFQVSDLDLLRRLVAEIAAGDFRDKLGHRLTMNTAYLEAAAVLEIQDVIDAERGR